MLKKSESTNQLRRGGAKKGSELRADSWPGGWEGRPFPERFGRRTGRLGWVAMAAPSQSCADFPGKQQPGLALPGLARNIILTLRLKGGDGEGGRGSGVASD